MPYTGLVLFMDDLKQLIHCNDNPLTNHHSILSQRPQLQLLYEEFGSMIQILFIDQGQHPHELEKVTYLKKQAKHVAEDAQDIIDLFVSSVNFRNKGLFTESQVFKTSLNLENVFGSIKSIKEESMGMAMDNTKMMDSSQRNSDPTVGSSSTRNPPRTEKIMEEVVVGLDDDAAVIVEKLATDQRQLNVVSIVGMGGLGKTTLATKVFNDPFVVYHFHVRAWVTVSQRYKIHDLLVQILESINIGLNTARVGESRLFEMLHKALKFKRYLIVIDDIWTKEAWDDLRRLLPNDNTGSRILLTSRHKEVAFHAKSNCFIHHLRCLTEKESWELLQNKVFHGYDCPTCLIKPGMKIAKNCHGLPLAVVVIAGILTKEAKSEDVWDKIACSVHSHIISKQTGCLESLALSYHHLPLHLRECFLYIGGFPEDFHCHVKRLIWLWVAEGFIHEDGNRSLEETAEDYLMDLVDRNLLIVAERKFHGGVKAFKVHDLVREICMEKAKEERFFLKIELETPYAYRSGFSSTSYKHRRVFTNIDIYINESIVHPPTPSIRSLSCFHNSKSLIYKITEYLRSFALLRVLDLQNCKLIDFPQGIALLIHLRYLAIQYSFDFPSSICNLWNLHTLVIKTTNDSLILPSNISNLVNLRHLWSNSNLYFSLINKPLNLQTISNVVPLGGGAECWLKYFPCIKELACTIYLDEDDNDFGSLTHLKTLQLTGLGSSRKSNEQECLNAAPNYGKNHIRFPATLKKLTLVRCRLPWTDMSIIQSLPNLEVLKLRDNAFEGTLWNTLDQEQFRQLKFLTLEALNIRQWEASSFNFPCLQRLQVLKCRDLEEIPLEIGDISTLELIKFDTCYSISFVKSIEKIQIEQLALGNFDLKFHYCNDTASETYGDTTWIRTELPSLETLELDPFTKRMLDVSFGSTSAVDRNKVTKLRNTKRNVRKVSGFVLGKPIPKTESS